MHPLLPFLEGSSGVLRVSLVAHDPQTPESVPFPFLILSEPDPYSVLIQARFLTSPGYELAKAFLLIQRDVYHYTSAGTRPITNRDVEHAWQLACDYHVRSNNALPPLVLSGQPTEGGKAAPLPPLFYCTKTATFFLPPCPKCGRPLEQCEDDALLQMAGLQPYASSLKRYLYCASCGGPDPGAFYVKARERTDPPGISDREELIRAFGRCRGIANPETRFPCPGCPHHSECYGPGNLGAKRITTLSFYPFFLLAFEAMSLCAPDFVALLSGATVDDLAASLQGRREQGRVGLLQVFGQRGAPGVPFLFESDERWFLEILYLKLSFLGEVVRTLVVESDILRHPEMAPSLERLWVWVPDQCGLLPSLWNFRVQLIDISGRTPSTVLLPDRPGSFGLQFLGLIWLETLVSNRRQGNVRVHDALGLAAEACPLADDRFVDRNFRGRGNPTFQPENIFWEPEGKRVDTAWNALWEKALRLGWTLLAASGLRSPEWSVETFQGELESLRREVRDALFPKSSGGARQAGAAREEEAGEPPRAPQSRTDEDQAIHEILERIRKSWKGAEVPQRKERVEKEEELEKTRILSLAGTKPLPVPGRSEAGREEEEEVFVETIILSPTGAPGRITNSPAPAPFAPMDTKRKEQEPTPTMEAEELEKTTILDATKLRGKGKDGSKK